MTNLQVLFLAIVAFILSGFVTWFVMALNNIESAVKSARESTSRIVEQLDTIIRQNSTVIAAAIMPLLQETPKPSVEITDGMILSPRVPIGSIENMKRAKVAKVKPTYQPKRNRA